jgi:cation:H+ antiporter
MVVTGVCAVIAPIGVNKELMKRDFPFSFAATVFLLLAIADIFIFKAENDTLSRINGISFLILFALYMVVLISSTLKARKEALNAEADDEEYEVMPVWKSLLLIVVGIVGIKIGGDLVVDSASEIAANFGLSPTLIGLTIVALGTSLPELVTSIVASHKGENDLALGNVVGSNIFNILLVLGVSSTIKPIVAESYAVYDLLVLLGFNIFVYIIARAKHQIGRLGGASMVALYAAYTAYIILR